MANVFSTQDSKILMPREIADGMIKDTQSTSTIAQLSGQEAQKFGEVEYMIFNDFPKAEFVEEGAQKSSTTGAFTSVKAKPRKAQVTMRFNEEVQWADEDYQLGVLSQLAAEGTTALSRALDLGAYHRINPLSGEVISGWDNYVGASTNKVELSDDVDADQAVRESAGLLIKRQRPVSVNGFAIDPRLTWDLADLQTKNADGSPSGIQRYPQLGLGTGISSFMGINTAQADTVSGQPEAKADTGIRGIVGDFQSGIRWGIQRNLPLEMIRFGDPDGNGDLKRQNQIALRLEIVYGWYVFQEKFALVTEKAASSGK